MAVEVLRRSFTVDEYHRMGEAGILREDDRVELIEGELITMTPIGSRHAACVDRLNHLFSQRIGRQCIVRVQSPIRLGEHSEPQPDLAILRLHADFYAQAHPTAKDVLFVVEVAETSAGYDREVKLPLYARSGIAEVWLVDLTEGRVEVYRQPSPQGYQDVRMLRRGEVVVPLTVCDLPLAVNEVLGS
ncbi:MAG: Uma2 family endonuclease [Candidatus Methylomirabilota bacterium]|nr:MAG: Uma2 family endonuclease [candidate division NC10 bacterium]